MADLINITTAELLQEIERRKREEEEREAADLKKRLVEITCPACHGRGKVEERDWHSGWDLEVQCVTCSGKGWIVAYKRQQ